jgi:microcystin-dependent protein
MSRSSRHLIAVASLATLAALQSAPAAAQSQPFIGQIMCAGYSFEPRDWVKLDGQLLAIAQNQALFALIGTTYGGDGQNTFAVPDMRGRTMIHRGQSPGTSNYQLGQSGGGEYRTLTTLNLPPHSHQVLPLGSSNDATAVSPTGKVAASKARTTLYAEPTNTVGMQSNGTSSVGSGTSIDNVQPFVTTDCYMALFGIFPSRN